METFVVRVFVADELAAVELCGLVEHVGSGRVESFRGQSDLVGHVLDALARAGETAADRPDIPNREANHHA